MNKMKEMVKKEKEEGRNKFGKAIKKLWREPDIFFIDHEDYGHG